jgi:competence protein ComEC
LYEPNALLNDVSLHLSFLATAGIVYLMSPIRLFFKRYLSNIFLLELVATTIAAYFATLPYIMHVFGTVSVYGLGANILALPLVPLAMLVSFLTLVASYGSHTLALIFGFLDSLISNAIIWIAEAVEHLPFSHVDVSISGIFMIVLYGILTIAIIVSARIEDDETLVTTTDGSLSGIIKY